MSISHIDRAFLELAVDLARQAKAAGDDAFGSVLVSADERILFTDRNRTVTDSSPLLHPEFTIAEWAVANLTPQERAVCTVYTSGEHCPMCAAAHGWAGLGRIVYASSSAQLAAWTVQDQEVSTSPIAPLPVQEVVPGILVDGPDEELAEVVRELHRTSPSAQ
jgi:tRNA(Arg) A34 adenosine deaminase TadA